MSDVEYLPVDPDVCRSLNCKNPPTKVGTWQGGAERGLRVPFCDLCSDSASSTPGWWTDISPWPDKSAEELEELFWKELNS